MMFLKGLFYPAILLQAGSSVSELRRSQLQYNSYIVVLGAESVARSGVIRLLRNMLSQQVSLSWDHSTQYPLLILYVLESLS